MPDRSDWAADQGFPVRRGSHTLPLIAHTAFLDKDTLAASWSHGQTNALIYGPEGCPQYLSEVVTLVPREHDIARAQLNFFHRTTVPAMAQSCTAG